MGVSHPAFATEFLWHVKYVVDFDDTEVWVQPLESWQVWQNVATPTDVAFAWTKRPFTCSRSIAFVKFRNVIHTVVRSAAELPDVLGDLNGEAIVQIAGHDEDFLAKLLFVRCKFICTIMKLCGNKFH